MDKLYTMRQASELVGMTVRYLQILDKKGKIECVRTPGEGDASLRARSCGYVEK